MKRSLKDLLIHRIRKQDIQSLQTESGSIGFVILMRRYPEVVIEPAPWKVLPAKGELIDFFRKFTFREGGFQEKTESGMRLTVELVWRDNVYYELRIRRWGGIQDDEELRK